MYILSQSQKICKVGVITGDEQTEAYREVKGIVQG